jgi:putative ABC transport system permease protein
MGRLLQDARFALRMFQKNPAFAATAICSLALGIGGSSAIFSVVNASILQPIPFADADRLVMIRDVPKAAATTPISYPKFQAWREQRDIFEGVGAFAVGSASLTGLGEPEQLSTLRVSADFLSVLGVRPTIGRNFGPDEERRQGPPAVLISHAFWRTRLEGTVSAIGRTLTLDDTPFTIVGVLPESFRFVNTPAILVPLRVDADTAPARFNFLRGAIGRLRNGLTADRARIAANAAVSRVNELADASNNAGLSLVPLREYLVVDSRPLMLVLLAAIIALLLIACVNTANLLLARASAREREMAIRASLGATRAVLVRQLLTESLLLSTVAGAIGLLLASWGIRALETWLTAQLPATARIGIDGPMLLSTTCVSLVTGVLFGLVPAIQASRRDVQKHLQHGARTSGGGSNAIRNGLMIAELAFSLVLLAGAGLLVRSFVTLARVDKGFDAEHVLTMHLDVATARYPNPQDEIAYLTQILARTRSLPGVDAAGMVTNLPFAGNSVSGTAVIEGRADSVEGVSKQLVAGDYFRAMRIALVSGRFLDERDTADSPSVAVVDRLFVRQFLGNENPIGKRIDFMWGGRGFREIVGVVGETREFAISSPANPTMYVPIAQRPKLFRFLSFDLAVRAAVGAAAQSEAVRREIHALNGTQVISKVRTLHELIDTTLAPQRNPMWLMGSFSLVALVLAAIGIYGVLAYFVVQRRKEIGTRMALGARPSDVRRMVLGHAAKLIASGVAIGLLAACAAASALSSLLFGVTATDLPTFTIVAVLLGVFALLACLVPTVRATRVDPLVALRTE